MFEWLQASGWTPLQVLIALALFIVVVSWALMETYDNIFKDRS